MLCLLADLDERRDNHQNCSTLEKMTILSRCVSKMVLAAILIMVIVFFLDILLFYTMRVSISPFDEDVFGKFWPPSDMFVPEIDVPIGVGETSYKFE